MVIALGILISGAANAFTAVTSGNWSSAATWGGIAPGNNVSSADIIIPSGITVTLDADVTFSGLLNQFQVNGTLSSSSMNKLTLTLGVLSGAGNISIHKVVFANIATATFAGTMAVDELHNSTSSLAFVATANVADSLVLETGSLMLNTNSNLSMMSNGTIRVNSGSLGISGGVFTSSNSYNVMYVGGSKTSGIELGGSGVQNVYVDMSSNTASLSLSSDYTVSSTMNVNKGQVNLNGRKLTLNGDLVMGLGAAFKSNTTSSLSIEGSGALTSGLAFDGSTSAISELSINRSGATIKLMSALSIGNGLKLKSGTLSLESGSSLIMNAGSEIHVWTGSMVNNSGNFTGSASYNVQYLGSANATTGIELSGSGLGNVIVNYDSPNLGVSLSGNTTVDGTLNMMNGHVVLNGQNLTLNGTLSQNANATFVGHPSSELILNMSSASSTTLFVDNTSAANNTLSKLTLNVSGSSALTLGSQLTIRNDLKLTQGRIMLWNNDLIVEPTGTISAYGASNYIITSGAANGRLQMHVTSGGSYVVFPVGTSGNYSPAHIQQTASGTSGAVMIRAISEVYTGGYSGFDNSVSLPVVGRTWMVEAASGVNVNMNMKLGWVAAAELNGFNRNTAMIRHYTNGAWDTDATAAASAGLNGTFELGRTGITSLSPFAVADASAPVGIKNNSKGSVGFEVYPNPAKDVLILETAATVQGYKYEVIDVTGKLVKAGATSQTSAMVDVASLKPGYYFIKVINMDDNVSGVKRFVKD